MHKRFVPITRADFIDEIVNRMGFVENTPTGTFEHVFERIIDRGSLKNRFLIRVHSSVDISTGITRPSSTDSIKINLHTVAGPARSLDSAMVPRTRNAFTNMRNRARLMWAYTIEPQNVCVDCVDGLMIRRTSRFGHFRVCTNCNAKKKGH
jgi:hypothetical protein